MEWETNSDFLFPPGFRFHPSDEELITHYLLNKLKSNPLPADVIAEIELYNFNPWELPGNFSTFRVFSRVSVGKISFSSLLYGNTKKLQHIFATLNCFSRRFQVLPNHENYESNFLLDIFEVKMR